MPENEILEIMLFIEIAKLEVTGGYIGIMLLIEMEKKFPGGHKQTMLFIEIAKL